METRPLGTRKLGALEVSFCFVPWGAVGMGYLTGKIDARTRLDSNTDLRVGGDRSAWLADQEEQMKVVDK